LITVSGTASITEQGNPYVFRFFPGDAVTKVAHVRYAVEEKKGHRLALIYQTTAYGQSGREHITGLAKKFGAELVFEESLGMDVRDMSAVLGKARATNPDVMLLHLHSGPTALLIRHAAATNLNIPIVASSAMHQPSTAALLEPAELRGVCAETNASPISGGSPEMDRFLQQYRQEFNSEPDGFALGQYDGVMMALDAVAKGAKNAAEETKALAGNTYRGLAMAYKSDGKGNMAHSAVIVCFDGRTKAAEQAAAMLQVLVNGVALGAAYALLALGFVLILNATSAVNFAQGDMVMAGGFAAVAIAGVWPMPGIVLLPFVLILMVVLGLVFSLLAYFPLKSRPPVSVFISTIATGVMLQNGVNALFGPEPRAAPPLWSGGFLTDGSIVVSRQALAIIVVAGALILGQYLLFQHTRLGQKLRATAQDREMAEAIGIPVNLMIALTFGLASALAGAAGLLLANSFFVTPTDGTNYIIKAYIAVTIGGWGSIPGAVAGALLIALFEVLFPSLPLIVPGLGGLSWLFSQTVAAIILYLTLLAILFFRPQGLFGEAVQRRA
jgi:branched-chain amino acid transport system permease protein